MRRQNDIGDVVGKIVNEVVNDVNEAVRDVDQAVNEVVRDVGSSRGNTPLNFNYVKSPEEIEREKNQYQTYYQPPNTNSNNKDYYRAPKTSSTYHYSYKKVEQQPIKQAKPMETPVKVKVEKEKKNGGNTFIKIMTTLGISVVVASVSFGLLPESIVNPGTIIGIGTLTAALTGSIMFRKKKEPKKIVPKVQDIKEPKKAKYSTGNAELDKIMTDGDEYISTLRQLNEAIPEEGISDSIDRIESASKGIFEYVKENPSKIPEIKKSMNYYLPTTVKLLTSYLKMSKQQYKGENISSTMFDIEGMMQTIATAFEKQLDGLFSSEAMDIQADITVFESILSQEGLKEDTFNMNK